MTKSASRTYSVVFIKSGPGCSCLTGRTPSGGWLGGRDAAPERVKNDSVKNENEWNATCKMQQTLLNEWIGT